MNDYDLGQSHGVNLALSYVRGYASSTKDEEVLKALGDCIKNFEFLKEIFDKEAEKTE